MRQVPVRELNQDTAGVLARVQRGESLEITSNGRPVARLLPVAPHALAALISTGLVRPASRTLDLDITSADIDAASGDAFSDGLARQVQQDREDRL
jgi:prevent-host-death family protein